MSRHELKTVAPFMDEVWHKRKSFEVRRNDRDFKVGDLIILREYFTSSESYGSREVEGLITYILKDSNYCKEGYWIIGFTEMSRCGG
jgi:hypothetical protein